MISFRVDGHSVVPPYLQIVQQVRQALRMGLLDVGDQLPTVREVVSATAINPNTVLKAYRDLEREGLVEARAGHGTFVRRRPPGPPPGTHTRLGRSLARWVREARDAGLDDAIEIVGVDGENIIHAREVERDAAMRRVDMAFERRADAERNDRRVVPGAELGEVDDVIFVFGEDHGVRRLVLEPGQRVAMRLADRLGSGEAVAKTGGEIGIEGGDRVARKAAFALAD